jgi:DNA invertase Pin-like site-specific DNA recombinase
VPSPDCPTKLLPQATAPPARSARMSFQILGAIAEFEHARMSERTDGQLAAARARGRTGGHKPTLGPPQVMRARQMYEETSEDAKERCKH